MCQNLKFSPGVFEFSLGGRSLSTCGGEGVMRMQKEAYKGGGSGRFVKCVHTFKVFQDFARVF